MDPSESEGVVAVAFPECMLLVITWRVVAAPGLSSFSNLLSPVHKLLPTMQAVPAQTIPFYPPFAAAPGPHSTRNQMRAFAIFWEDVLAPMSFLCTRLGLQPTRASFEAAKAAYLQDRYLQQALASVEEEAIELLRTTAAMGPVFVVTTKSSRYMEVTCAAFLPRLAHCLTNVDAMNPPLYQVRVVSAPHKFSSEMESSAWLARVYQQICTTAVCDAHGVSVAVAGAVAKAQQLLQYRETGTLGLVSISAAPSTQVASVRACQVAPHLIPKAVNVPGGDPSCALNLEHFFAQLRTLQGYVVLAAAHATAFSMTL